MLPEQERHKLLIEWNDTGVKYPRNTCLHQLFEAQVERTPEAVAVVYQGTPLTYRELNCRANQLAHYLNTSGVRPETLVGLFMERSLEMVIDIYGILKAGGAYVPLDPEYPPDRVAYMIEDTKIPILVTWKNLMGGLPDVTVIAKQDEDDGLNKPIPTIQNPTVVCLDADRETKARESADNPINEVNAENLAYVIYTSGSTGKPKGEMNCHRGICNRLIWMQDEYQLTEPDRVLQKDSLQFRCFCLGVLLAIVDRS